jgi:hypothetical protein
MPKKVETSSLHVSDYVNNLHNLFWVDSKLTIANNVPQITYGLRCDRPIQKFAANPIRLKKVKKVQLANA